VVFINNLEESSLCFVDTEVFQWELLPINRRYKASEYEFTNLYWISFNGGVTTRVWLAELQRHRRDSLFRLFNVDFQPETRIS
jgi:hypothetical protein